jgi:hypothetical protein
MSIHSFTFTYLFVYNTHDIKTFPWSISSKLRPVAVRLTCTDHRIIEILGLRPSNRLPVSYLAMNMIRHHNNLSSVNYLMTTVKIE